MTETVIRHRGGGMDDDGNAIPWTNLEMDASGIEPGASEEYRELGRNGQRVECSVYFEPAGDITSDDELTVRGTRYQAQVLLWKSPDDTCSGMVVLCTAGVG